MNSVYIAKAIRKTEKKSVSGKITDIKGENFYKIENFDQMPDFFMSIISSSDHWMFISSNGSLTAGRKDRDHALFPYYTEDKIHDYKGISGSYSCFIVGKKDKKYLWEPFTSGEDHLYSLERNIYKNFYGNKLVFEEINKDLSLTFRYSWTNSEKFGFVREGILKNNGKELLQVNILDGIKNIMPAGSHYQFQNEYSNLLDAYKKSELLEESYTGLFTLSAVPVDKAEPSESLSANTVFCLGFENPIILLSANQIDSFKKNIRLYRETDIRARRGAYLINTQIDLAPSQKKEWKIIAEVNQDGASVANLHQWILAPGNHWEEIKEDIQEGALNLRKIAGSTDGLQLTQSELSSARHFSNSIFNVMRGGIFIHNYAIDTTDFSAWFKQINKTLHTEYLPWINNLPSRINVQELTTRAEDTGNADLQRITMEYLPLTFSRRHGDPSRPWNRFSVETRNPDGSPRYNYQGNWRDIFQNWEALSYSFPGFLEGMIAKFLNASTADGYNPYRIMRSGMDWECPDPKDPWAYIGYWGDHQIIYLQKIMELAEQFKPGKINRLFNQEIFTYANVPYEIKPLKDILANPKDTIIFNHTLNDIISARVKETGADARLLYYKNSTNLVRASLIEKIFVTLLTKISNFIPEAGIWMNTQRPEWNDANNALVGNGTSMVTLYYLRRFLVFWKNQLEKTDQSVFSFSSEVAELFSDIYTALKDFSGNSVKGFSDNERKEFVIRLGLPHEKYRTHIYSHSFGGNRIILKTKDLSDFLELIIEYTDQSIRANKRDDGLYNAYNLITISDKEIKISPLYEMLEGQVAILSSGFLSAHESIEVLEALKKSKMYRRDQNSYMLYPDRQLPLFTEKNRIPAEKAKKIELFKTLSRKNEVSVIRKDKENNYYFNANLRNAYLLEEALNKLDPTYAEIIKKEKKQILDLYENIFNHKSFTGRSGTFYGYEGLGSIYWHMVSKLLLAVQECFFSAVDIRASSEILHKLKSLYYEIKEGIGLNKTPDQYGAFPVDAYSHTPGGSGVKQPGLTGQVKEDVISRFGELGLRIQNGGILFDFSLLKKEEFLTTNKNFEFIDLLNHNQIIPLKKNQLGMTICQVPVIIRTGEKEYIQIRYNEEKSHKIEGNYISPEWSETIFKRTGKIRIIEVFTKTSKLY